jgi:hypothetical protein
VEGMENEEITMNIKEIKTPLKRTLDEDESNYIQLATHLFNMYNKQISVTRLDGTNLNTFIEKVICAGHGIGKYSGISTLIPTELNKQELILKMEYFKIHNYIKDILKDEDENMDMDEKVDIIAEKIELLSMEDEPVEEEAKEEDIKEEPEEEEPEEEKQREEEEEDEGEEEYDE